MRVRRLRTRMPRGVPSVMTVFAIVVIGQAACVRFADSGGGGGDGAGGLQCPSGYIAIEADGVFTTSDFCVMKYEAKLEYDGAIEADGNADGDPAHDYDAQYGTVNEARFKAVSRPEGRPWISVARGINGGPSTAEGAIEACDALNEQEGVSNRYSLISNAQWQTIGRHIVSVPANWSSDSNGHVAVNHGHADDVPGMTCDALNEYVDASAGDSCTNGGETDFEEKRTHTLPGGEEIWDLAGNAFEWVRDNNSAFVYRGDGQYDFWTEFDSGTYPASHSGFGPLSLTAGCGNPTAGNYCGFGFLYDGDAGAIARGGGFSGGCCLGSGWGGGEYTGIFTAVLEIAPDNTGYVAGPGFRCVYEE